MMSGHHCNLKTPLSKLSYSLLQHFQLTTFLSYHTRTTTNYTDNLIDPIMHHLVCCNFKRNVLVSILTDYRLYSVAKSCFLCFAYDVQLIKNVLKQIWHLWIRNYFNNDTDHTCDLNQDAIVVMLGCKPKIE